MVIVCVALTVYFLLGLIYFWGLELNSISIVQSVLAIGLAVDYSAHIAHSYLLTHVPNTITSKSEKRKYKATNGLGNIGSSVFHGAFSTFLAIVVLSPSESYIFVVFFRMWFGIIIFGVANGFVLLPVLLSLIGPINRNIEEES